MPSGFSSKNEKGTFVYSSNPLSISIRVNGEANVIDDHTHICQTEVSGADGQFTVKSGVTDDGWTTLSILSNGADSSGVSDAGTLSLRNGAGNFSCPGLTDGNLPQVLLTNCSVK